MMALWRHIPIHGHLLAHIRMRLTGLDLVRRLHRIVDGWRSHHSRAIGIPLRHVLRVKRVQLPRRKLRWRRRSPLLLFLNGNSLDNGPHPSFAISLDFLESVMLRQIVAHATLPSVGATFENKVRILSLDSSVYLRQGHLTSR